MNLTWSAGTKRHEGTVVLTENALMENMPWDGELVAPSLFEHEDWSLAMQKEPKAFHAIFRYGGGGNQPTSCHVRFRWESWDPDAYVLMPAAVYNGNRFRVAEKSYPPYLHEADGIGPDMPVTITDVPHLRQGPGESVIHLRSGDMATPCVGVFFPSKAEGLLLLADAQTPFGYTGFRLEEGPDRTTACLTLEAPAVRPRMYAMCCSDTPSDDAGAVFSQGDMLDLRFQVYRFPCPDVPALFRQYCAIREDLSGKPALRNEVPFSHAFRLIEEKFNARQWNDRDGYYMTSPDGYGTKFGDWQAGWCGSGMHTLAFLADGEPVSVERARKTWDAVFGTLQRPDGWIHPVFSAGRALGDDFCHMAERPGVMLMRKNADLLLFAGRHIELSRMRGETVPSGWMSGYGRLADAFVRIWHKYGQFGQFLDMDREEILQGGTVSAGIAPGGLILAWKLTGLSIYREVAEASARQYHDLFVRHGLMNGGPGEILQNPDSESAFGLLESLVSLFEMTGDPVWLPMAEACGHQCASWCVSYDFPFPEDNVFGRLGMRTAGSVYANVQNKHSAPGICTLSGVSLFKLYRATGNRFWLELIQGIAHNITQYLSRPDRLIPTWDGEGGTEPPDGAMQGALLPSGCMCERVNMSDWETKKNIGGIFNGSCWCETSTMLTYSEVPGIWFRTDTGELVVFDHVEVTVVAVDEEEGNGWKMEIHNPTAYPATVKILAETAVDAVKPLGEVPLEGCLQVTVGSGSCTVIRLGQSGQAGGGQACSVMP